MIYIATFLIIVLISPLKPKHLMIRTIIDTFPDLGWRIHCRIQRELELRRYIQHRAKHIWWISIKRKIFNIFIRKNNCKLNLKPYVKCHKCSLFKSKKCPPSKDCFALDNKPFFTPKHKVDECIYYRNIACDKDDKVCKMLLGCSDCSFYFPKTENK